MIKISVFNETKYLKSGKLKKRAQPELSRTIGDTGELSNKDKEAFLKETAIILKRDYLCFKSPYIFQHIEAQKATGERVFIYEEVTINGNKFMTSPTVLLELLTK